MLTILSVELLLLLKPLDTVDRGLCADTCPFTGETAKLSVDLDSKNKYAQLKKEKIN